ncbi:MAG TPA: hypothetical protein PKC28_11185, partial [Bdellovibrionales bacterium]|nr:hypothetical protein [Bdellovibrionales bacterium]
CTSAWDAAGILRSLQPALAKHLERCESLPLVAVTAFFPRTERDLDGFGCLFPKLENFTASGVLFNGSVFSGREEGLRSETWIFGGDDQPEAVTWSDGETLTHLLRDRRRLNGQDDEPAHFEVTRWPRAIPCYSVDWERALDSLKVPAPLYLHGNYMGALGLARILDRSRKLAQTIKENYRG